MITPTGFRAYRELRNFVKLIGGTMAFHAGGTGGGGTWTIELWGRTSRSIEVRDDKVNELDQLYIPKVEPPTTWQDYDSPGKLVDDVFWKVIKLFP